MSLSATARGLWLFNNDLTEEVQNNDFVISSGSAEFTSFQKYNLDSGVTVSQHGLVFRDEITFTSTSSGTMQLSSGGQFSFIISFWWYSPGPVGYTRHAMTRNTTSKVAPILAIASTEANTDADTEDAIDGMNEFFVYEVASSETKNAIRYEVCQDNGNPTHRYESSGYDPGLHHIFISHHTVLSVSIIQIYIDGELDKIYSGPLHNISTPAGSPIRLNSAYHGHLGHKTTQDGAYISELVIRAGGMDLDSNEPNTAYKFGWQSLVDTDYVDFKYDYFGIGYDQPSTVTTNQIYTEGGNIYLARSNGDILKGTRPIWDNEFDYNTDESLSYLNAADATKISRTTLGLQIDNTTIRI